MRIETISGPADVFCRKKDLIILDTLEGRFGFVSSDFLRNRCQFVSFNQGNGESFLTVDGKTVLEFSEMVMTRRREDGYSVITFNQIIREIGEDMSIIGSVAAERQRKHIVIHQSINGLEETIDKLKRLSMRITDSISENIAPDREGPHQALEKQPSLLEFMNGAGERINILSDRVDDLINEIESYLF